MPRVIRTSDVTMCGEYFPRGVPDAIHTSFIEIMVFSEKTRIFRPEIWLDEKRGKGINKAIITFG